MFSIKRHQQILQLLEDQGEVTVNELVALFEISEMTVRRDLILLEHKGLLRRVHGGAILDESRSYEPPFLMRSASHHEEKQRIGKAAAALIKNGDSIAIDVGTTTLEIARNLKGKNNLTVITPCLQIATQISDQPGIRLILTGGILRPGELSMVGHLSERVFQEFFVDKLFIAAAGIDLQVGLSEYNLEDTLVKQAMIRTAKTKILVADASKFNKVALAAICPLKMIDCVVTDIRIDPNIHASLMELGIDVILV
jgi:DeoR/GlpR family transcriptional regulator of sugar metabolism